MQLALEALLNEMHIPGTERDLQPAPPLRRHRFKHRPLCCYFWALNAPASQALTFA